MARARPEAVERLRLAAPLDAVGDVLGERRAVLEAVARAAADEPPARLRRGGGRRGNACRWSGRTGRRGRRSRAHPASAGKRRAAYSRASASIAGSGSRCELVGIDLGAGRRRARSSSRARRGRRGRRRGRRSRRSPACRPTRRRRRRRRRRGGRSAARRGPGRAWAATSRSTRRRRRPAAGCRASAGRPRRRGPRRAPS